MKYLGVKIPDELAEALEATERPKSEVVREALEAYLGVERGIPYRDEIIKLIDERVEFYMGKTTVKPEENQGKTEVKPSETTVKPEENQSKTEVKPSETTVKPEENQSKTEVKPSETTVKPEENQSKTEVKPSEATVKPEENQSKTEVKPGEATVKPEENQSKTGVEPEVREILLTIKSFHDRDKEPLVAEVAELAGMESRPMGRLLSKHGIRATKTHRDGKPGRYFTFELREGIKELVAGGELEK